MASNDFPNELKDKYSKEEPENYEAKCLWTLLIDTSGSMSGSPIDQVNNELQRLKTTIEADEEASQKVELSIIEFNSSPKVLNAPQLVENMTMPTLKAQGTTAMAKGLERAMQVSETRKQWYKDTEQPYYRPFIILITDGAPNSKEATKKVGKELIQGVDDNKHVFIAFGVEGADMQLLNEISHSEWPALKIDGYNFNAIFDWLSNSMSMTADTGDDGLGALKKDIQQIAGGQKTI